MPEVIKHFVDNMSDDIEPFVSQFEVIKYDEFEGLAKCLIVSAALDPVVDDSRHYYAKLKEEKIDCDYVEVGGTIHGFFR